jgi:hypothetical protein
LLSAVTCERSHRTPKGALSTVTGTLSKITQLALSFSTLTLQVLFATLLLEVFAADEVAYGFLSTTDGLIP